MEKHPNVKTQTEYSELCFLFSNRWDHGFKPFSGATFYLCVHCWTVGLTVPTLKARTSDREIHHEN